MILGLVASLAFATPLSVPITIPHAERASATQPRRIEPIGGYTLALLWAPEHCVHPVPGAESYRCDPAARFGFVLHGLWPDGLGKSWPQYCADAEILSPRTIRAHFRATPSAQLMQHEWAKHGACMGGTPDNYFERSNRLFGAIRYPDIAGLAQGPLTAGTFVQAFAAANPGMRADMVNLSLDRDGWLREVWLCLDVRFKRETCRAPMAADRPVRIRISG